MKIDGLIRYTWYLVELGGSLPVNIMIECKEHRQWLDQKPAPYTDYQSTHMVKS